MFNPFKKKEEKPRVRTITDINYLVEIENEDKIFKLVKDDLDENDEYSESAKYLKENYDHEKVYKYEPYELPFKIENKYVFAQVEDKWYKVGRLKKTANLEGELTLYLYPNEYKYVTEDAVEKDKGSHYFGIETKTTITL